MKKVFVCILAAILFVGFVMIPAAQSETKRQFGRFVEICHDRYTEGSRTIYQYLVYEKGSNLVYVLITDGNFAMALSPYVMRDYYGRVTVGMYNKETGGIDPAESSQMVDENEVWAIENH